MNADVHPTPADRVTNWNYEADVIVAGSGGGLVGAYTAAREGLSVMVVEATDQFGGTTAYSGGGGMWFPCNPVLQRAGSDDTLDAAFAYFHAAVGDCTPVELQRTYVYGGSDLIAYLEQDAHFEFDALPWPDYYGRLPHARLDGLRHTVSKPLPAERLGELAQRIRGPLDRERLGAQTPKCLVGGRALIGRLLSAITAYPHVSLHLNSPLVELVTSNDGVVGAVVEQHGRRCAIRTRVGALLAAGGFENSPALRRRFGVPGDATDTMGAPGNLGLALEAGMAAGAAIDLMDQAWWSPGFTHPDGRSAFSLWFTGGIFVNQDGKRFVNESGPYDRIGKTVVDQIACGAMTLPFWMIYDDREGRVPPVKATNVSMVEPERYVEAGLWHTADTLPELAAGNRCERREPGVDCQAVQRVRRGGCGRGLRARRGGIRPRLLGRPVTDGADRHPALPRRLVRPLRSRHQGWTRHRQPRPRARHRRQPDRRALRRR